ncbi:MAG: lysophospholipid acyltransferase family protein [Desulfotalea sp.]
MKKITEKILKVVIPRLVYWLMMLWFSTLRIKVHGAENRVDSTGEDRRVVAAFWHYSIFLVLYMARKDSVAVMVSSSKDGDYLAKVAELFGYIPVRGSSNRGGLSALKDMLRQVKKGYNAGVVSDGSQGPPLKVQTGTVYLASKTGNPILPIAWSASKYKVIGSWDRTVLPLPFSKVDFFWGDIFKVPQGLGSKEIEEYREKFEVELVGLYKKAWAIQGKDTH